MLLNNLEKVKKKKYIYNWRFKIISKLNNKYLVIILMRSLIINLFSSKLGSFIYLIKNSLRKKRNWCLGINIKNIPFF